MIAVVGALLLGLGVIGATSASVEPACPSGTELVARFTRGPYGYTFKEPTGNSTIVTVGGSDAKAALWSSTEPIVAVVVKAGVGSKDLWLTAGTSGSFDNSGLGDNDISSVQFCRATGVNPSAAAAGFDAVTLGDAALLANESEGPIAVGGNLRFNMYQVAIHSAGSYKIAPSDAAATALLVRGKLDLGGSSDEVKVNNGWLSVGDPTGVSAKRQNPNQIVVNAAAGGVDSTPRLFAQNSHQSLESATRASTFDFEGAFNVWTELSRGLAACPANVTLAGANSADSPWNGNDAYIYNTGAGQRVLNVDAATLAKLTSITFRDGAAPSAQRPLVINVSGVPENWNPPKLNGNSNENAKYTIWNFGSIGSVTIKGSTEFAGTAFAPSGAFNQNGDGNLVGAVYAKSFVHGGSGELHTYPFATKVLPCSVTPPSTTTTTTPITTSTTTPVTKPTKPTTTSTSNPYDTTTSNPYDTTTSSIAPPTSETPSSSTSSTSSTSSSTTSSTSSTSSSTSSTTSSTSSSTTSSTTPSPPSTDPTTTTTTTEAPTTTDSTTTSTEAPATSEQTTSSIVSGPTTSIASEVLEAVVVATSITPNDNARVAGTVSSRSEGLAFTGSRSWPLIAGGAIALFAGVTMVLVSRDRTRRQQA